jgi:CheY-like chemotaxis protein
MPRGTTMILAAVDDLMFKVKILETAKQVGVQVATASTARDALARARAERPRLIILDLHSVPCAPLEVLKALKADPDLQAIPTLGYFSHVQEEVGRHATEAGCDQVLPRSAFSAKLPDLLRPYAPSNE